MLSLNSTMEDKFLTKILYLNKHICRFQWLRGLRRGSAKRVRVKIPPWAWMFVSVLWALCGIRLRSLRRADHSSRRVQPSVVCPVSVIARPCKGRPCPEIGSKRHKKKLKKKKIYRVKGISQTTSTTGRHSVSYRPYAPSDMSFRRFAFRS